jgi:hypothetical protein
VGNIFSDCRTAAGREAMRIMMHTQKGNAMTKKPRTFLGVRG